MGDACDHDHIDSRPGAAEVERTVAAVEARVSATGQAMPQPGDLFGPAVKVKQGARDVQLLIDQVRQ